MLPINEEREGLGWPRFSPPATSKPASLQRRRKLLVNGGVFSSFLGLLNSAGFAGANGWRLPTRTELQTILLDFPCTGVGKGPNCICPSPACVETALDPSTTQQYYFWTSTGSVPSNYEDSAWYVYFGVTDGGGTVGSFPKSYAPYARAVRGGL